MAKLIGTAGHVDHGKTSLIRALTGIDADRLPEEKQRGLTIDIGFAYAEIPGHGRVSIVDVPGHEKFLSNMLVGAQGVAVALLCVAADAGVMPQTREHVQILELLPVEQLVVALTRCDLTDAETRALAGEDVTSFLSETRFKGSPVLETSAESGEGIEELRLALSQALTHSTRPVPSGPWFLPIDRVFVVKGHGVVVTGTLAGGAVSVGDRGVLEPGSLLVRVRSIQSHEVQTERGEPGRRTALNLTGVRYEDVHRGQQVGAEGIVFETTVLDAKIRWLSRPKHGTRVRVAVGAEEVIGKVFLNDENEGLAQLRLESALAVALGQPILLRRYSPPEVLGGGTVTVPQAEKRRKSERAQVIEAVSDESRIVDILAGKPQGLPTERICRALGKTPQALGDVFERLLNEEQVEGFAGLWFHPEAFRLAVSQLASALAEMHTAKPTVAYVSKEVVVKAAQLDWAGKPLDRIVARLAEDGVVVVSGPAIRLPGHRVQLTERQSEFLNRVVNTLDASGVNPPTPHDLAKQLPAPFQAVEEILRLGTEAGLLVRLDDVIFYTGERLRLIEEELKSKLSGRGFSAGEFRDAVGTSRKYAIPLLEYFDRQRVTQRTGDQRIVRPSS